jgi:membrane protein
VATAAKGKSKKSPRSELPGALRELIGAFREKNLLTWASALAFQIATSVVPFMLFGFGLIGFLRLDGVWASVAKNLKPNVSPAAFTVINNTADKVLHQKQVFWVTLGFALAIWEVSGGIRATMGGLNSIYELEEKRRWIERVRRSIALAVGVSLLVIAAIAVVVLGPKLYGDVGQPIGALLFLLRWAIAAVLLAASTAITVRWAPDGYQPAGWVTVGTAIVVGSWVLASILFGIYIRFIASPGSIFGALATVVILFGYIYISAITFFAGAEVDALLRRRVDGNSQGR